MDQCTDRDARDRQRITRADIGSRAGHDGVSDLEIERCDDVALLTVGVVQEGEAGGAVRVILDRRYLGRYRAYRA